jgi:hypothetical protein
MDDTGQVEVIQTGNEVFRKIFVVSEHLAEIRVCGAATHTKLFL